MDIIPVEGDVIAATGTLIIVSPNSIKPLSTHRHALLGRRILRGTLTHLEDATVRAVTSRV